jgi:hypothetical protein
MIDTGLLVRKNQTCESYGAREVAVSVRKPRRSRLLGSHPDRGAPAAGSGRAPEPWFARTTDRIRFDEDGWTIRSADGSRTAHSEHTIAIDEGGPLVLTRGDDERPPSNL